LRWYHIARDTALTGTAIFMLVSQVFARNPSPYILGAAIALTTPAAALAIKAVVTSSGGGLSSPQAPLSGGAQSAGSSRSSEESGE
jgi:hypothetical protein